MVKKLFFFVKPAAGQAVSFVAGGELVDELVDAAVHDGGQVVDREPDAVVGDAVLGIVVGADLFRALARAYLGAAVCRLLGAAFFLLQLVQAGAQDAQGTQFVLQLRALILAGDDHAGRLVIQAHGGGVLLHILPARAR